jgi:transcriptional regulator with XRE-family HTH domain
MLPALRALQNIFNTSQIHHDIDVLSLSIDKYLYEAASSDTIENREEKEMERTPNQILRQERTRRGWTQKRLAEELNALGGGRGAATGDMVRKWEQGIHPPSPFYTARLCAVFGCDADQLGIGGRKPLAPVLSESAFQIDTRTPSLWIMNLVTVIDHWRSHFTDLQQLVHQEIYQMNALSRREALTALAALPVALHSLRNPLLEEILARYAASLTACWSLYFEGEAEEIKRYLTLHVPLLVDLGKNPSKYQRSAASLASQALQLAWLIALQDKDFGRALYVTHEAAVCGEIANDPNLLLAARVRRAHVYSHLKNPIQQMRHHEAALQYVSEVSPLLKSWMHMVLAENYASLHRGKEAEKFASLARESFPTNPEKDPNRMYVPVTEYTLSIYEAKTFLRLAQPERALKEIQRVEQGLPDTLVPRRVELLNQRLVALCALGEMEEACRVFEIAEKGARQSKLRYNEVCEAYSAMCIKWPDEKRVLGLEELLRR